MQRNRNNNDSLSHFGISLLATAFGAAATGLAVATIVRRRRQISFRGKVVLITGGSRGLGLALARRFVEEGAKVAICARGEAELRAAQDQLRELGAQQGGNVSTRLIALDADVRDPAQCERLIDQVETTLGLVDVLVNNAGTIAVGPLENQALDDFRTAMDTHFTGPLNLIWHVLPSMRRRRAGRIVNISSIGGKVATPHMIPYNASKFALTGLSEGLRTELSQHGIYVTTVCPGLMRTGSPRNAFFKGRAEEEYAWFTSSDVTPVLSINPDRIAGQILDACRYGDAELISPFTASIQAKLFGLLPGVSQEIAALFNRKLPGTGSDRRVRGAEVQGATPAAVLARQDAAAKQFNQFSTDHPTAGRR
ncbi:MAG TPA: SDR family oxidoreductase [Tepidisphaeraceae bacterium]|nr:SDR family oxidoreductase [Tepidisphaeraceae bacterium]